MKTPDLDLLREGREEEGLEPLVDTLLQRRGLLWRGTLIGAALPLAVAGLTGLLFLQRQFVRAEIVRLTGAEDQAKVMGARLAGRRQSVERLTAGNRKLVEALTSVRTTSALLTELQLRTPDGVQLLTARAAGPDLVLKGQAVDPMAFARINAFQLELQRSSLLDGKAVRLNRVARSAETKGSRPVAFEITAPYSTLPANRQLPVLRSLGSDGMARRFQLLVAEGLVR